MTLVLAPLLAFLVGWLLGEAAQRGRIAVIVQRGELWKLPGFGTSKSKPPPAKPEDKTWN